MQTKERAIMKDYLRMLFVKIDIMKSQQIEIMRKHVSSWVFKAVITSDFEQ